MFAIVALPGDTQTESAIKIVCSWRDSYSLIDGGLSVTSYTSGRTINSTTQTPFDSLNGHFYFNGMEWIGSKAISPLVKKIVEILHRKMDKKKRGHWPRLMMTCYRRLTGDSVIPLLAKTTQREICTPSEDH